MEQQKKLSYDEQTRVANEIEKSLNINGRNIVDFVHLTIAMPADGFKLKEIIRWKIIKDSIETIEGCIEHGVFRFSGEGKAIYEEPVSKIDKIDPVHFGGEATTGMSKDKDRMYVTNIVLDTMHRSPRTPNNE